MKVHGAPNTGRDQRRSKRSTLAQPSLSTDSDGCTPDSTGDEDADGSQRDGAEADDEEGNDGDPDVQAPSDLNFDMGKGQAGHHQDQKSRPETEDEEGRQQAKSSSVSSNTVAPTSPVKDGINSDEDDYNDVDLISESGDEEPALEQLEEKAIIDSEEDNIGHPRPLSPPNSPAFPLYSVGFGNIDHELSPWLAEDPFFAEQINLLDPDGFACDTEYHGHDDSLDLVTGREDAPRRRVRFADPLMLPSETEQTESLKSDGATGPSTQFSVIKSLSDESRSTENNRNSIDGGAGSDVATLRPRTAQNDETPFEGFGSADNGDAESSVGSSSGYESGSLLA